MEWNTGLLAICFFLIAFIYSSVGFGGGSSYLALLALPVFLLLPEEIRPIALICNIIVVTSGSIIFYREGKIVFNEVWPFLIFSVPTGVSGRILETWTSDLFYNSWYHANHCFPVSLDTTRSIRPQSKTEKNSLPLNILLGGGIGFLSGLVSIGGGIFLSPVLHLIRWSEPKKISALASLFILVNSISGLAGQFAHGIPPINPYFTGTLVVAVFFGGQIGSRLGARKFNTLYIKRITAVLILIAGVFILKEHL